VASLSFAHDGLSEIVGTRRDQLKGEFLWLSLIPILGGTIATASHYALRPMLPSSPKTFARSFEDQVVPEIPVLYRVARRLTRNDAEAEDLVSQTLLLAVRAWDSFDGRHLRSWLVRILRNEFTALRRRVLRKGEVALDDIVEPGDEGFWREINWRMVGDRLVVELDRLPEEYRMAVTLCDVEEMSYEEAAAAMDVPVGTVRSRLFRGRRILRARLVSMVEDMTE
jgi:RNA polymerase sigma-70 factor (ECF subfamily)